MSAYLSPVGNEPAIDANGNPLSGGKWYTYLAGTSTPAATYTDSTGVTPMSNPIILNSRGMPTSNGVTPSAIWIAGGAALKFILTDANDVPIAPTFDNLTGINDPAVSAALDQWVRLTSTPTYVGSTSFSVVGDQTATLTANRRVKTPNTGGTVYSTITGSSYSGGTGLTSINVTSDSGGLDSGLSAVSYGLLTPASPSIPANFNAFGLLRAAINTFPVSNALTISISAGLLEFRSATVSSSSVIGLPFAAQSVTIPSGATMGQSNGVAARLWVALISGGGTVEMAVINTQMGGGQICPISESGIISTTALSAAADNAGVWYSTSARSNWSFRLIGYIENTQAAAGTWVTGASVIQPMGPGVHKPGDVIQTVGNAPAASNTGTTQLPADATIPQITEGDQYLSQAITPSSAINTLVVNSALHASTNAAAGTAIGMALFQDATANALKAMGAMTGGVGYAVCLNLRHQMQAGTVSATTFRIRTGANAIGTTTFNGLYGAAAGAYMDVTEIMA